MKLKDLKTGEPYFYETNARYLSPEGDGAVYVLSTETYREGSHRSRELPFIPYPKKDPYKRKHLRTGILAIRSRWGLNDEHREILSKITFESVVLAGMKIPEHLLVELGQDPNNYGTPQICVDVVQARYILGEWDITVAARKEYRRQVEEAKVQAKEESQGRISRWVEVVDFLEDMRPDRPSRYHVSSFGEEETKEIRLEDMEELVRLARLGKVAEDAAGH